ncbi:hypothetical protein NIES4075_16260 [Tolypothrix sp. NIES-4075]|nr:hypothetical protein NIES4075_16260 [Tolypothrix sp. NIES-4075]
MGFKPDFKARNAHYLKDLAFVSSKNPFILAKVTEPLTQLIKMVGITQVILSILMWFSQLVASFINFYGLPYPRLIQEIGDITTFFIYLYSEDEYTNYPG